MYQSFYNLSGKPFRLSPDPAFFFPSRGHKRALAYLRYGLHQNEGFVVITGAPGTGKTTLAQILLNEMNEKNVVVAHLTTTQLEADDMLRMVSASFGLRYENLDKAALLKGIESYLLSRSRENKRALLVIDEAQNLPMRSLEELRMLSNLQVGDKALLQTFLLGQVQFRNMLEDKDLEQLRQRVIANFHLGPLAADESQRYIESRLRHVGWNNDPAFAEIAFEKIHEYTEGVPRRINMLCDRILLYGCMEEQHNITGEVVDEVRAELEQEVGGDADAVKQSTGDQVEAKKNTNADNISKSNKLAKKSDKSPARQEQPRSVNKPEKTEIPSSATTVEAKVSSQPDKAIRSNGSAESRVEPEFPADLSDAINDESEQYIDITQDFIDKFDASLAKSKEEIKQEESAAARQKPVKEPAEKKERQSQYRSQTKTKEEDKKEKVSVTTSQDEEKQNEGRNEEDVLGNTVTRKKPAITQSDDDSGYFEVNPEPAQISERDLFRVIPGGKDNHTEKQKQEPETEEMPSPAIPAVASGPSSEDVVLRRILRLVLAFHRSPSSFPGLDDPTQPLPEGVSELLELSVADDEVLTKVSPAAVMGISPVMLRAAVRFFIRRTLFANDSDHYRMLGLTSGADIADIERHYDLLMRLLRQDKQPGAAECVDKVGRSYETLMRFDDSPQPSKTTPKKPATAPVQNKPVAPEKTRATSPDDDKKAAAVLEALENPELTIDFSDDAPATSYQPKQKPVSAFVGYGKDQYIPDPRITRRRIHLLGQAAILGIGALVVVLGIFITQLEPDAVGGKKPEQLESTDTGGVEEAADANERRLGLSFNDGSSEKLPERFTGGDTDTSKPKTVFDDTPKESKTKSEPVTTQETKPAIVAEKPKPAVQQKPAPVVAKVEPETQAAVPQATSPASKFKPVPVQSKTAVTASDSGSSNTAQQDTQGQEGQQEEQQKFSAVPITAITAESGTEQSASNQFPGKDIPVKPANVTSATSSSPAAASTTLPVLPATPATTTTQPAATSEQAAALSPIEAALSEGESSESTQDVAAATTATTSAPASTGQSSLTINDFQLDQLLGRFTSAYDKGDINKLMQLFARDARTNSQTTREGIEREYKGLFNSTASRKLILIKPLWNNEGRFARGVGEYSATIVPQGGEPYTSNGKYTLQAYLDDGKVIISRFYFSNELTVNRKDASAGSPTRSDLKGVLSKFTRYYETADLDNLMNLFASNAQTNDQNTLAGIRKDHKDLFDSTQQRQIFLKDVKWQIKDKLATGNGNFEVMVQSNGQDSFATVKGTITIEVEKSNNGLKITRFLHKAKP